MINSRTKNDNTYLPNVGENIFKKLLFKFYTLLFMPEWSMKNGSKTCGVQKCVTLAKLWHK